MSGPSNRNERPSLSDGSVGSPGWAAFQLAVLTAFLAGLFWVWSDIPKFVSQLFQFYGPSSDVAVQRDASGSDASTKASSGSIGIKVRTRDASRKETKNSARDAYSDVTAGNDSTR